MPAIVAKIKASVMRILCLDIGSKRIGVAATDPMGWTAQGICTIVRQGKNRDFEAIVRHVKDLDAQLVLIGLPLDEEGKDGPAAKKVRKFADELGFYIKKSSVEVSIQFWDERYSTSIAEERLIAADVSRAKRKKVIDKMAAVAILEDYLESHDITESDDEGALG